MTTTASAPGTEAAQAIARLHETASADRVFGTPIERDGTTLVPVATVRFATARGRVPRRRRRDVERGRFAPGQGDAVAAVAQPAGAYVIRKGRVRWRPAVNAGRMFVMGNLTAVAYFGFAWLTARARGGDGAAPSARRHGGRGVRRPPRRRR